MVKTDTTPPMWRQTSMSSTGPTPPRCAWSDGYVTGAYQRLLDIERTLGNMVGVICVFGALQVILLSVLLVLLISFANHPFGL